MLKTSIPFRSAFAFAFAFGVTCHAETISFNKLSLKIDRTLYLCLGKLRNSADYYDCMNKATESYLKYGSNCLTKIGCLESYEQEPETEAFRIYSMLIHEGCSKIEGLDKYLFAGNTGNAPYEEAAECRYYLAKLYASRKSGVTFREQLKFTP